MRRIKVRIRKGRVVEPVGPDKIPEEVEGYLTVPEDHAPTGETLLSATNRAYAILKADSQAWKEELQERALWEGTLSDGLEPEDQKP